MVFLDSLWLLSSSGRCVGLVGFEFGFGMSFWFWLFSNWFLVGFRFWRCFWFWLFSGCFLVLVGV